MRNRVLTSITLAALGLCPMVAASQAASPETATKVAIVNMQQAIGDCAEGKKAFDDLQAKYRPTQEAINKLQQEVSALQDQIQRQMTTLSADEQTRLSRELQQKQTDLKRKTEDAQTDFQNDRQDTVRRIGTKMLQVIGQYAKQHGYDLVLDSSSGIYYAADGLDITGEVIKQYDSQYPVQAASAAKPAASSEAKKTARKSATPSPANH
jgi:outer membrane protein